MPPPPPESVLEDSIQEVNNDVDSEEVESMNKERHSTLTATHASKGYPDEIEWTAGNFSVIMIMSGDLCSES